jgi:putative oxidoreductase
MTATATATAPARTARRAAVAAVAVVQAALALQFAAGGVLKLAGSPAMVEMFADIGAGSWLRYLVGAVEVAGAIGLVVPRLAGTAALGLVALMVGASVTNVAVLHTSPALPLAYLVAAAALAQARRGSTARLLHALRS